MRPPARPCRALPDCRAYSAGNVHLLLLKMEKLDWKIKRRRKWSGLSGRQEVLISVVRHRPQGDHESTRHIELIHLLVQHPYYAVSNTRMEPTETASTRRGWRCGGRSMWQLYAWEVFSLNQLVDPRRAQPTCQLNYLLLMNPCTDLILIFNPDLFFPFF